MNRIPLLFLLGAVGCGTPAAPLEHVAGCATTTLGPLAGRVPNITWTGNCGVAQVIVVPVGLNPESGAVWHLVGESGGGARPNNLLRSGITYGAEPELSRTWVQDSPLISGTAYRVELRVTTQSFSAGLWGALVASAEFTP